MLRAADSKLASSAYSLGARQLDFIGPLATSAASNNQGAKPHEQRPCSFHRQHAVGRDAIPVGHGGLRYAETPREFAYAADGTIAS